MPHQDVSSLAQDIAKHCAALCIEIRDVNVKCDGGQNFVVSWATTLGEYEIYPVFESVNMAKSYNTRLASSASRAYYIMNLFVRDCLFNMIHAMADNGDIGLEVLFTAICAYWDSMTLQANMHPSIRNRDGLLRLANLMKDINGATTKSRYKNPGLFITLVAGTFGNNIYYSRGLNARKEMQEAMAGRIF